MRINIHTYTHTHTQHTRIVPLSSTGLNKTKEFVERFPVVNKLLITAEEKTKVQKEYLAIAALTVPILLMFALGGGHFIIDLIAYLYPAYASIKAIETDDTDDDTQWLTYWLVFSLFKLIEGVADSLISFIPFYFIGKIAFLVWCFYPGLDGAKVIYMQFVKPNLVPLLGLNSGADEAKKNE